MLTALLLSIPAQFQMAGVLQMTLFSQPVDPSFDVDPAGDRVVYSLDGNVWEMRPDGEGKSPLTQGTLPVFSPDLRGIVFVYDGDLYLLPGETKTAQLLVRHARFPVSATPDPYIGYLNGADPYQNLWIYDLMDESFGPRTKIFYDARVLYHAYDPASKAWFYTLAPMEMDTGGLQLKKTSTWLVHETPKIFLSEGLGGPVAFSSRGGGMAYVASPFSSPCLFVGPGWRAGQKVACGLPMETTAPERALYYHEPAFSPDGELLAWVVRDQGGYSLQLYSSSGDAYATVHRSAEMIARPKFHPDGSRLYFLAKDVFGDRTRMALFSAVFVQVYLNGHRLESEPPPVLYQGKLLVPLRTTAEALGAKLEPDRSGDRVVVTHPAFYLELMPRRGYAWINGEKQPATMANISGQLFVPLRLLADVMEASLTWESSHQRASVEWAR